MERKAKNSTEVLKAAKWILENVGWCQGQYAKSDDDGKYLAFCASGAIDATVADWLIKSEAKDRLMVAISSVFIPEWNDGKRRTRAQVLKAFDKAIRVK